MVLLLGGCCAEAWYEALVPEPLVRLPGDEAPHCYGGEWWYYSGRLVTDDQHGYGIHAVVFHDPHLPVLVMAEAWAAHLAVLDEADGSFAYDQTRRLEPTRPEAATVAGFDLSTALLKMTGGLGTDRIRASFADRSYVLDLSLEDERRPVLHGTDGYVAFGEDGSSFYYSRPRMRATGTLEAGGEAHSVTGVLWFDRQWGRDVTDPWLAWDWFSIRLTDRTDVMLYVFRDADPPVAWGTYLPPAGEPQTLSHTDFVITPTSFWTSPHTQATYPVGWEIQVVPAALHATVAAVSDDQEIDARASTLNVYWEGLCTVEGIRGNQLLDGVAYVEMTNYVR